MMGTSASGGWPAWLWATTGLMGACLGSFTGVLVYRLPRNLGWVRGRSFCPACGQPVRWYDNVPLASWLLLRGRCRHCQGAIGWQTLALESLGAVVAVLAFWRCGPTPAALALLLLVMDLAAIALVDWQHMIIPHTLTVGGMAIGLVFSPWWGPGPLPALLGGAVGAGAVVALAQGYRLLRGQPGMGGGDAMLMGMVGLFVGPWGAAAVLFGGALLGTVYAVAVYRSRLRGQCRLPFGTFLAVAAVLVLAGGEPLLRWYMGRIG